MSSIALQHWDTSAQQDLDELVAAHQAVAGAGRGRRLATRQLNYAYALLLSSHFQAFCRNLHSEAAHHISLTATAEWGTQLLRDLLSRGRRLDTGNPNPGNLGADFGRFGMEFWTQVRGLDRKTNQRQRQLSKMNAWRNAIAHQDFTGPDLDLGRGRRSLRKVDVTAWRSACRGLARTFDLAVCRYVALLVGSRPW